MGWNGRIDSSWVIYCVDTFRTMPSCIASPPLLTMRPTNSALNNSVGAPLEAASFPLCAMCDANSSPSGLDWYILQSCIVFTPSHLRRASNRPLPSVLDWYTPPKNFTAVPAQKLSAMAWINTDRGDANSTSPYFSLGQTICPTVLHVQFCWKRNN